MRTKLALCMLSVVFLSSRASYAQQSSSPSISDTSPASAASLSVRAVGVVGTDIVGAGVSVSRPMFRWMALEATVMAGSASDSAVAVVELLPRFGYIGRSHALTLGIGPSLLRAEHFGWEAFAQGDISYEYRFQRGPSLLVGYGVGMALNESGSNPCTEMSSGYWTPCGFFHREQFHFGDLTARARVGLGWAF